MTVAYGRYKQVDADFTSRVKSGPQGKVHDAPVTLTVTVTKVAFRDEATGFFIVNTAEGVSVKGNSMFIGEGVKLVVTGKWKNGTGNWPMYIYADKVALAEQGDAIKVLLGSGFLKGVKTKMAQQIATHVRPGDLHPARPGHRQARQPALRQGHRAGELPLDRRVVAGAAPLGAGRPGVGPGRPDHAPGQGGVPALRPGADDRHQRQPLPAHCGARRHLAARRRDRRPGMAGQGQDRPRRPQALCGGCARGAAQGLHTTGTWRWPRLTLWPRRKELARPTLDGFEDKVRGRYADKHEYLLLQGEWLYLQPYYEIERDTAQAIAQMIARPAAPIGDWDRPGARAGRVQPGGAVARSGGGRAGGAGAAGCW